MDAMQRAHSAIDGVIGLYDNNTGLWGNTGWWQCANCLTTILSLAAIDSGFQKTAQFMASNTFHWAQSVGLVYSGGYLKTWSRWITFSARPGFKNYYYDDEGWWALAWVQAWDLFSDTRYWSVADSLFQDMTLAWTDQATPPQTSKPCPGVWWNKGRTDSTAIANELFFALASQLGVRSRTMSDKHMYESWARKAWEWFNTTGIINSDYLVNDGLNAGCKNNGDMIWTYNQGVIIGALLDYHLLQAELISPVDVVYLDTATKIADAAIRHFSDSTGVIHEPCDPDCDGTGQQFKGVFIRNLARLNAYIPHDSWTTSIRRNAESIWYNASTTQFPKPGRRIEPDWSVRTENWDDIEASSACSGTDAMIAAAGLPQSSANDPLEG